MYPYSKGRPVIHVQFGSIRQPSVKILTPETLVDSGAFMSAIPPSIVEGLELQAVGTRRITTAAGTTKFNIYRVNIEVYGMFFSRHYVFGLLVEGSPFIGRDILNNFHICLDGKRARLEFIDDQEKDKS